MIGDYRDCPKCKKKSHIKAGPNCPHCKFHIGSNFPLDLQGPADPAQPLDVEVINYGSAAYPAAIPIKEEKISFLKEDISPTRATVMIVLLVVGFFAFGVVQKQGGISAVLQSEIFLGKPVATLESADLYQQFTKTELAAHNKYMGKRVTVSGPVLSTSVVFGKPWLGVGGVLVADISCYLNSGSVDKASQFVKGQRISVTGTVDSYRIGTVSMTNCKVN